MFDFKNLNTAFTAFLLILLVFFLYISTCQFKNITCKKRYTLYVFLLILLCTFAYYNDYWSLEEAIPKLVYSEDYGAGLEKVYIWIASIVNYNYPLWRFVCWGCGVIFISYTLKIYKINNNFSLFVICCCYYWLLGYARSAIAMTMFTLGYSYLSSLKINQKYVIAFIIMFLSLFVHKSQAICIISLPLLFFSFNRKWLLLSLLFLPVSIQIVNHAFENLDMFFSANSSYYDMEVLQSKAERYIEYDKTAELGPTRALMDAINYSVYYSLFAYNIYKLSIQNNIYKVTRSTKIIYILMYVLLYFSISTAFGGFEQSVYSYRIYNMAVYPGVLCMLLMLRDRIISLKAVRNIALICLGGRILESFIYELYVILS